MSDTEDQKEKTKSDAEQDSQPVVSNADAIKEKRLKQLAAAREKALEKRRMLGDMRRKEQELKEKVVKDRIKKIQMLEETLKQGGVPPLTPVHDASDGFKARRERGRNPSTKKKVIKKVIEVSESSTDDTDTETESENEIEYVVRRKPKTQKPPPRKAKTTSEEYDTPKLTAEVAKNLLKKKVYDDAQVMAMRTLFPYANF